MASFLTFIPDSINYSQRYSTHIYFAGRGKHTSTIPPGTLEVLKNHRSTGNIDFCSQDVLNNFKDQRRCDHVTTFFAMCIA